MAKPDGYLCSCAVSNGCITSSALMVCVSSTARGGAGMYLARIGCASVCAVCRAEVAVEVVSFSQSSLVSALAPGRLGSGHERLGRVLDCFFSRFFVVALASRGGLAALPIAAAAVGLLLWDIVAMRIN
eukprot:scaffold65303_cov28-Tisochrysis_lutea.AAC.1